MGIGFALVSGGCTWDRKGKDRKFKMQNARRKTKGFKQVGKHTSSSGLVIDSSMRERICFSTRLR